MNRIIKKIGSLIGILFCFVIFILNIFYVSKIADDILEGVNIKLYGLINLILTSLIVVIILIISKKMNEIKMSKKSKILICIVCMIVYIATQIYWINIRNATPVGDQKTVYSATVSMYKENWNELEHSKYLELYPQQITLATAYATIFKIFGSTNVKILQYLNVIANSLTAIILLLISKLLAKSYKINKIRTFILITTFFTLQLLSTFIYGDIISMPMYLLAIYFAMKYGMEEKNKYIIVSACFMSISYILRMNNLICIIALIIYFILNMLKKEKNIKKIMQKGILIILFILISILPATIIKTVIQNKLILDKEMQYPTEGYIYMGMQESYKSNGWYSDYGSWAWEDLIGSKDRYKVAIKERIKYFTENPKYFIKFYIIKVASMWTENTYAGLWYNQTYNFDIPENEEKIKAESMQLDEKIKDKENVLVIYQKALILTIFGVTILAIIKNRKNLSNELILLITVFIGGFLFHIIWEAKSRYIIPYIVILIPIASICINNFNEKNKEEKPQ